MTQTHPLEGEPISDFFERIDWDFVKRVEITKTVDGQMWATIVHYRSGKYMHHAFKHGRLMKAGDAP